MKLPLYNPEGLLSGKLRLFATLSVIRNWGFGRGIGIGISNWDWRLEFGIEPEVEINLRLS